MANRTQPGESPEPPGMSPVPGGPKKLEAMRANPRADWNIADVKTVADKLGMTFTKPSSGSHYKVSSEYLEGILTVPAHKPIKAIYIKRFCALAEAHLALAQGDKDV